MLLRARINGPRAIVGALIAPDADDNHWPGDLPTPTARGVADVTVLSAFTESGFEELAGGRITLVRVVASSPVDFVVVRPPQDRR